MKKNLIFALLFAPILLLGQTRIKDKQEVYGTWKKSGSPYIIEGEAIVPVGKTLKIKPGVIILFQTGEERDYRIESEINNKFNVGFLRVKGNIIAEGKKNDQIKFDGYGNGTWGNVMLEESTGNVFKYCYFTDSYYMRSVTEKDNATGAISFLASDGIVEFCIFANNGWTAINCKNESKPILRNLTIVGNNYGIECNSSSNPIIQNIILWDNKTAFYFNGGSKPSITNSCLQDEEFPSEAVDLENNILGKDPEFVNAKDNDYSLQKSSPCAGKKMGAKL